MASRSTLTSNDAAQRDGPRGGSNGEIRRAIRLSFGRGKLSAAPNSWLSALILLRTFVLMGAGVALLGTLNPVIWPVSFVFIGVSQYHLSVAIHEASHFGLFRSKRANEFVATLLGTAIGFGLEAYRQHHWSHHKLFGSVEDPDYGFYCGRYQSWIEFALDMIDKFTLIGLAKRVLPVLLVTKKSGADSDQAASNPYARPLAFVLSQIPIIGLFVWATTWWAYFVFWLLPLTIFPGLLNGLRMLGEHGGLLEREGPQVLFARTTMASPGIRGFVRLERFVMSPFNFNLHHEHHLFPQLPYHVLPALHDHLRSSGYYAVHPEVLSESYTRTFRSFVGRQAVTAQ